MSSTYRILCLSHDPALIIETPDWNRPHQAEEAIHTGIEGHTTCDLAIGRYSYPHVTLGCPATRNQPANLRCCHNATDWTDSDWARLLAAGYQTTDPLVQTAVTQIRGLCWPWERLKRLRLELDLTIKEQPRV
jgi:hypothetical protein